MFTLISLAIIFVISISLHEYAHARTSNKFGDPTPKLQGRLTPNPLVHIDPLGFLFIFLINFGRGKPVIINPAYYKNRRRDELLVSLAGPATNILLACAGIVIAQAYLRAGNVSIMTLDQDIVYKFRQLFSRVNISLAIFNLIPLPPLDGYRLISFVMPGFIDIVDRYGRYISIAVILLLVIPNPIRSGIATGISEISQFLFGILRAFRGLIFL